MTDLPNYIILCEHCGKANMKTSDKKRIAQICEHCGKWITQQLSKEYNERATVTP